MNNDRPYVLLLVDAVDLGAPMRVVGRSAEPIVYSRNSRYEGVPSSRSIEKAMRFKTEAEAANHRWTITWKNPSGICYTKGRPYKVMIWREVGMDFSEEKRGFTRRERSVT